MKEVLILLILIFFTFSCKKQELTLLPKDSIMPFPVNKVYIVDLPSSPMSWEFYKLTEFSELSNDFTLRKYWKTYEDKYLVSDISIPDSMKNIISNIIFNYQRDTVYVENSEIQDYTGKSLFFFIKKNDGQLITIRFQSNSLPDDLSFLYNYLYRSRLPVGEISDYNQFKGSLFDFERECVSNLDSFPPSLKEYPIALLIKETSVFLDN